MSDRYSPFNQYAPAVPQVWGDPTRETERGCELWLPPGHAEPVHPTYDLNAEETS